MDGEDSQSNIRLAELEGAFAKARSHFDLGLIEVPEPSDKSLSSWLDADLRERALHRRYVELIPLK